MTAEFLNQLLETGAPADLETGRSFGLDRIDCFWIVEQGAVDIFSVLDEIGENSGRRYPLCSVRDGDIILPISPECGASKLRFTGVPISDTKVTRMNLASLDHVSRDPVIAGAIEKTVEAWVSRLLLKATFGHQIPDQSRQIEEGQTVELEQGQSVHPGIHMLWTLQVKGSASFMGCSDLGQILEGHYIPLCSGSWLEALDTCRLRSFRLSDLLSQGIDLRQCLTGFQNLIYNIVLIERAQRDGHDSFRVLSTTDQDHLITQSALTNLASVLGEAEAGYEASTQDSLFNACQLVGHAQGIKVSSPSTEAIPVGDMEEGLRLIANASSFRTRRINLKGKWWKDNLGPLLGKLTDSGKPVALIPDRSGKYHIHDPVTGDRAPLGHYIGENVDSRAFMFYRPFPEGRLTPWSLFLFGLEGNWQDIRLIILLAIGSGGLATLIPVATGVLYDSVIPAANRTLLIQMVTGLAVGSLVAGIFQLVQGLAELRSLGRMEANLEAALWDRLLNLPAVFFRRFSSGDLANRASTIFQIQQIISGAVMTSILSGIFCTFNIALIFYYGANLALMALAILTVAVVVMLVLFRLQLRYLGPQLDLGGKISNFNIQILTSIAKLRSNAAEKRAFQRWSQIYSKYKALSVKYRKLSVLTSIFRATLPLLATFAVFAGLARSWKPDDPSLQTGEFLAFTAALTAVISAVMAAVGDFTNVLSVVPMYERMKPIVTEEPETQTGRKDPGRLTGSIEMAHVNFRYKPDSPLILKDVNIKADPGEFIALVGPSGSGKSTILRLLIQFETPEAGSIYYDGQRLADLDIQAVRRQFGVVLQGGRLLSGSIYESITGGLPLTTEEAWEAARMASLDKDIQAMPMGMHTIIGDGGSVLSGGQRQRLLIARAIVKKPRIVFFDEATSALDNVSQAQVSRSLEELQATRIVVAHRLSAIRNANRIYVLVNGQVMETGSYDELMERQGVFSELAKRQIA